MSTQQFIPDYSYRDFEWTESRQLSAFNQTRNSFLGLNVIAGDFSLPSLATWMLKLTPNSGGGVWIAPFRGLPPSNQNMPLDLVYLDADCRVIDLVKAYPYFRLSPSSQPAASVLALPSEMISHSDTRRGDLLVVSTADELAKLRSVAGGARSRTYSVTGPFQISDRPSRRPLEFPGVGQSLRDDPLERAAPPKTLNPIESFQAKDSTLMATPQRGRLARWLFPAPSTDRRKTPRKLVDNLTASFWTGGFPTVDTVRDVSLSGLFVITAERWYPGTLLRMTLTIANDIEEAFERSICVCAEVIRWGNDGVGLRFAVDDGRMKGQGKNLPAEGANRRQLDEFLRGLLQDA
jgi:hypothetical protein